MHMTFHKDAISVNKVFIIWENYITVFLSLLVNLFFSVSHEKGLYDKVSFYV